MRRMSMRRMSMETPAKGLSITEKKKLARRGFPWGMLWVPVLFLAGLGAGYLIWGRGSAESVSAAPPGDVAPGEVQIPEQVQRYDIPEDDDYAYGPSDAPITIIEFSDYECPYCQRWFEQVWLRLRQEYAGQVRLVYRDLPLPGHPNAVPSAEAANCAGEQGKYYEYHDLLFNGELGLNPGAYQEYAAQVGLDQAAFQTCVEERRFRAEVEADVAYAAQIGISSTPTFFINGIPLVGAQPYEVFQQVVEMELAGKIP